MCSGQKQCNCDADVFPLGALYLSNLQGVLGLIWLVILMISLPLREPLVAS